MIDVLQILQILQVQSVDRISGRLRLIILVYFRIVDSQNLRVDLI